MSGAESDGLVRLPPVGPAQVAALARLHAELLPRSAPARLGMRFMTDFYFRELPASRLIVCDLFRHDGRYVAFNTYTERPDSFMRDAFLQNLLPLCGLTLRILAEEPRRIRAIWEVMRKNRDLPDPGRVRAGYWLTFGVEESARRVRVAPSGARISSVLVSAMLDYFRGQGFDRVDGAVERDNKRALLFYHSIGFKIEDPGYGTDLRIHLDLDQD